MLFSGIDIVSAGSIDGTLVDSVDGALVGRINSVSAGGKVGVAFKSTEIM